MGKEIKEVNVVNITKRRDEKRLKFIRRLREKFIRHAESLDWRTKR